MPASLVSRRLARILVSTALLAIASPISATETVVLHAGSTIQAESVTREGDNYRIILPTLPNDPLIIPATEVLCLGANCLPLTQVQLNPPAPPPAPPVRQVTPGPRLSGKFEIHGSNTIGERLMPELIKAFAAANGHEVETQPLQTDETSFSLIRNGEQQPSATIELYAHGSGTAVRNMIDRKAQIGMRSAIIPQSDVDEAQRAGLRNLKDADSEHVLALDGLAIIVNRNNPVGALSPEQIAKIFAGEIGDWSQVGGTPGAIRIYRRDDKSGTTDTFNALVMTPFKKKIIFSAKMFEDSEKLVNDVANDPSGIGYVGWAYVANKAHALSIVTSCGVPMKPSVFSIKTGEYPLTRRLFLYTNGAPSDPLANQLLTYALSDEAFSIIDNNGFISRGNSFLRFDAQVQRLLQVALTRDPSPQDTRVFVQDVQSAKRASITLHFRAGGTDLDAQGMDDLRRLAHVLKDPSFQSQRFIVAGFTSDKEVQANQLRPLALRRANLVAQALLNDGAPFYADNTLIRGYGPGAPVACNGAAEQELNQRVEIWVVDDSSPDRATQ